MVCGHWVENVFPVRFVHSVYYHVDKKYRFQNHTKLLNFVEWN